MWSFVTERNAWAPLAVVFLAGILGSCTVFDDLVPDLELAPDGGAQAGAGGDPGGAGTGGAPTGVGGAGAAGGGGGALDGAYLSLDQAVRLCSRVTTCAMVGPSIRASIGVPVNGPTFSHCVHWLAGPLPTNRPVTPGQRDMLTAMAKGSDCPSTLAEAYVEKLVDQMDSRCQGLTQRRCSSKAPEVIDCSGRLQIERCGNALLGPPTVCTESATVACATPPSGCIDGFATTCVEGALSYCYTGLWQMAGCPERGLECEKSTISCVNRTGTAATCTKPGDTQCGDGDVAKLCAEPIGTTGITVDSPFDCASIEGGATCRATVGDPAVPALRCELAGSKCSPEEGDKCSGNDIDLCLRGERTVYECGSIGMVCKPSPVAHCEEPS